MSKVIWTYKGEHITQDAYDVGKDLLTLTPETDEFAQACDRFNALGDFELIWAWGEVTRGGLDELERAKEIHARCVERVLGIFGVPVGEAGIGVVPRIPHVIESFTSQRETLDCPRIEL